jgi:hypothetical protein
LRRKKVFSLMNESRLCRRCVEWSSSLSAITRGINFMALKLRICVSLPHARLNPVRRQSTSSLYCFTALSCLCAKGFSELTSFCLVFALLYCTTSSSKLGFYFSSACSFRFWTVVCAMKGRTEIEREEKKRKVNKERSLARYS